jgi:diguanylate cyclase (GGDEF)-like protein
MEMANEDTTRLSHLIENLLDLSKIEAGKMEFKKKPIDLADIIKYIAQALKGQAKEKHISITTSISNGLPPAYADPEKIEQVLVNLIGNAIKFTPEEGKIIVGAKKIDEHLEVSVADTGVGISSDNLPKLFDRFQQFGRPSGGGGSKGTGLGLSISKGIVEGHNGKIWAESNLGKGSRFTFTVPVYDENRIFAEHLDERIKQAKKDGTTLSLIAIKVTNLEEIKDIQGLKKAKEILARLEEIVKTTVRRPTDTVIKYPNAEVIAVIAETDKDGAFALQKRIKETISVERVEDAKGVVKVSAKFGIATYPEDGDTKEGLLNKAEESLK